MSAPVAPQNPHPTATPAHPRGRYLARLSLLALGVVYGDIGTSPLYALQQAFHGQHAIPVTPGSVLGVLSLIFWSLVLIVTIKYHVVIIRADNKGEGGVLALMALVNGSRLARGLTPRRIMIVLGIFGAALLYADGALTPAVSVLSAVEGLSILPSSARSYRRMPFGSSPRIRVAGCWCWAPSFWPSRGVKHCMPISVTSVTPRFSSPGSRFRCRR